MRLLLYEKYQLDNGTAAVENIQRKANSEDDTFSVKKTFNSKPKMPIF